MRAEAEVEHGQDSQGHDGRRHEAAEEDDRHRAHDLEAGPGPEHDEHERHDHQDRGGRQGRSDAFLRPALDEFAAEDLAFVTLEVLEVADHEETVARREPEQRQQADQRAEGGSPPLIAAASTPPASATGSVRNANSASRKLQKAARKSRKAANATASTITQSIPTPAAVLSTTSAWYSSGNTELWRRSSMSAATSPTLCPLTFAWTSRKRETASLSIAIGPSVMRTSATSPRRT